MYGWEGLELDCTISKYTTEPRSTDLLANVPMDVTSPRPLGIWGWWQRWWQMALHVAEFAGAWSCFWVYSWDCSQWVSHLGAGLHFQNSCCTAQDFIISYLAPKAPTKALLSTDRCQVIVGEEGYEQVTSCATILLMSLTQPRLLRVSTGEPLDKHAKGSFKATPDRCGYFPGSRRFCEQRLGLITCVHHECNPNGS